MSKHRINPLIETYLNEQLAIGRKPKDIYIRIYNDERFRQEAPSIRTIERMAKEFREAKAQDTSPVWRFVNSDPETSRYVLPVIWEIINRDGNPDVVTEEIAEVFVKLSKTFEDGYGMRIPPLLIFQISVTCISPTYREVVADTASLNMFLSYLFVLLKVITENTINNVDDKETEKQLNDMGKKYAQSSEQLGCPLYSPYAISLNAVANKMVWLTYWDSRMSAENLRKHYNQK